MREGETDYIEMSRFGTFRDSSKSLSCYIKVRDQRVERVCSSTQVSLFLLLNVNVVFRFLMVDLSVAVTVSAPISVSAT